MRLGAKHVLTGLAVLAMVTPVWARTYKEQWDVMKPMTIGSMQVKAGDYQIAADDSKTEVNVLQSGKVLASVSGQWVKLPKKAEYTTILSDGDKVTQLEFGGSDQAFKVQ